jgi:serine/threonine protein kinase
VIQIISHAWAASSGIIKFHETPDGVRQAIKIIAMDANLESDIAALVELAHPYVLRTEGFTRMEDSANLAVVTELMENGALSENLSRKRHGKLPHLRSPIKISKIVAGVVLGMRFMHSYGCAHGNLKPANLLLDRQWRVRIADFGISHFRHDERLLLESFYPGDLHYLPPERFEGEAPSKGKDLYAFGLILYELVVDNPLFPPDLKPQTVMKKVILGTELDIPQWVKPDVAALIERCCSYNCEVRPSIDEILVILKQMNFRILQEVRDQKVFQFVSQIESREERQAAFIEGTNTTGMEHSA